jgi:hypothetical protein
LIKALDYSRDGALRSLEESRKRLGIVSIKGVKSALDFCAQQKEKEFGHKYWVAT